MHDEMKTLQGTWSVATLEIEGNALPSGVFAGARIIVDGNRFTSLAMGATYEGTFIVRPETTPKQLDMTFTAGPESGKTTPAIYEINRHTWKLCLSLSGTTRPTVFATSPQSGHALETLVREATVDTQAAGGVDDASRHAFRAEAAAADFRADPRLEGEWSMVSGMRDGIALDDRMVSSAHRVTTGNETIITFGGQLFTRATYSADRSRNPYVIEFHHSSGMLAGRHQSGIYRIDNDLLTVSFSLPGQAPPPDFSTTPGDCRTVTVWRKI